MTFAQVQADAVRLLSEWQPPTPGLARTRTDYLQHIAAHDNAVSRDGGPDHLTSGGFVFDPSLTRVALVLHGKAKLWLQPGGHFEDTDAGVVAAAVREVREETGLPVRADDAVLVDLHQHELAAAFGRCRVHRDIRVAVRLDQDHPIVVSDESDDAAWWSVDDLPERTDPDLPATIRRVRDQLRAHHHPAESVAGRPRN